MVVHDNLVLVNHLLTGEDPRLLGFYHMCGFNASGVVLSGGCGEQLAKWIIHGRPDFHMYSYDIRSVL